LGHPLVSVCIVTSNRVESLRGALCSSLAQEYDPLELVIVDNASSDGTCEMVRALCPDARLIRLPKNVGCPGARNIAFANAAGEYYVLLDDDARFSDPDTIDSVVRYLEERPCVAATTMNIREHGTELFTSYSHDEKVPTFVGAGAVLRAQAIEATGFFDDQFYRQGEEEDLSIRLLDLGWEIRLCRSASIEHFPTTLHEESPEYLGMSLTNRTATLLRYAPARNLFWDVGRRVGSYSVRLLAFGRIDVLGTSLVRLVWRLRELISSRRPLNRGYSEYRRLQRSSRRSRDI
jgi:GT2 family glycosyltransferase